MLFQIHTDCMNFSKIEVNVFCKGREFIISRASCWARSRHIYCYILDAETTAQQGTGSFFIWADYNAYIFMESYKPHYHAGHCFTTSHINSATSSSATTALEFHNSVTGRSKGNYTDPFL